MFILSGKLSDGNSKQQQQFMKRRSTFKNQEIVNYGCFFELFLSIWWRNKNYYCIGQRLGAWSNFHYNIELFGKEDMSAKSTRT